MGAVSLRELDAQTLASPPVKVFPPGQDRIWAKDKVGTQIVEYPQTSAWFGFVVSSGLTGDQFDSLDDLVVAAIEEDDGVHTDAGRAYVYLGNAQGLASEPRRLTPSIIEQGSEVGTRGITVGSMKGPAARKLVWVPAFERTVGGVVAGAIDAYVLDGSLNEKLSVFPAPGLTPPPESVGGTISALQQFGHCIVLADVNNDGLNELIVGAPQADNNDGRFYIYWADATQPFGVNLNNPTVTVVKAPDHPAFPQWAGQNVRGGLGFWLDAADMDGDGKADLLVAEPTFPNNRNLAPPPSQQRAGLVHLYSGAAFTVPPAGTVQVHTGQPVQTLRGGIGSLGQYGENFGFYVWLLDIDLDGKKDAVIHGETTDWQGPNPPATPGAGSLYFFRNESLSAGNPAVMSHTWHHLYAQFPEKDARFGKNVALTLWRNDSLNVPQLVPALLVGHPDATYFPTAGVNRRHAGTVSLYFLSDLVQLPQGSGASLTPSWSVYNHYMDDFGLTTGPQDFEIFGRYLAVGNFTGTGVPELVATANGRDVPTPGTSPPVPLTEAGGVAHLKQGP